MAKQMNSFDFDTFIKNTDKVKEQKARKKTKTARPSKLLRFDISPEDSPLKIAIIERINEKNLTYADLYEYCTAIKDGNESEGQNFGYNLISGLKNRHSMLDTTAVLLCDFLKFDIHLVPRKEDNGEDDDSEEDDI